MRSKPALLAAALAFVFVATLLVALNVMPEPHTKTDYMVAGAVATFAAMIGLFITVIAGRTKP